MSDSTPSPPPPTFDGRAHLSPISLRGTRKSFGGGRDRVTALHSLDLDVEPGGVLALLGPNGAGKTTSIRLMLGLAKPDAGTVRVFGGDPTEPAQRIRCGAMLQISGLPDTLRVQEHIRLFSSYYPRPLPADEVLEICNLRGLENRYYGKLSGGERQRLAFALAICGDPDLLFLDEPTVGLDVTSRRAFWQQIRLLVERGKTILLTTHYLEEADALADRIVLLNHGSVIADGSPAEIKQQTSARRIRCRTGLPPFEIECHAGVIAVEREGDFVEILARSAEDVVRDLLSRDPELSDLEVSGVGLEQAFLSLTRDPTSNSNAA